MSSHAVSSNAHPVLVELLESIEKCLWKLISDIAVHLVSLAVWLLCSIDVEPCARTEVIGVIFTLDVQATWN